MSPSSDTRWRFGAYELDLQQLRLHGRPLKLQQKVFLALLMLVEHHDRLVTREELRQALWSSDTFVNFDQSLNTAVRKLRELFGDSGGRQQFIQTIPRRGYRFIAAVANSGDSGPLSSPCFKTRIAVVPFKNVSNKSGDPFATELTDHLILELVRLAPERIAVICLFSGLRGRGNGTQEMFDELQADYVLKGSVRHCGDRFRVCAALVQTSTRTYVWSESYEQESSDNMAEPHDIASRIVMSLAMKVACPVRETEAADVNGKVSEPGLTPPKAIPVN